MLAGVSSASQVMVRYSPAACQHRATEKDMQLVIAMSDGVLAALIGAGGAIAAAVVGPLAVQAFKDRQDRRRGDMGCST